MLEIKNRIKPVLANICIADTEDAEEIAWALQKILKKKNRQRRAQGGSSIGYNIRIMKGR